MEDLDTASPPLRFSDAAFASGLPAKRLRAATRGRHCVLGWYPRARRENRIFTASDVLLAALIGAACDEAGLSVVEAGEALNSHLPSITTRLKSADPILVDSDRGPSFEIDLAAVWSEVLDRYRVLASRCTATNGRGSAHGNAMRAFVSAFDDPDEGDQPYDIDQAEAMLEECSWNG